MNFNVYFDWCLRITRKCFHLWIIHAKVSALTGKKQSYPSPTSTLNHSTETCHPISFDDFCVLSSSNSTFELLTRESLIIPKLKPSLNENIRSVPLSLF